MGQTKRIPSFAVMVGVSLAVGVLAALGIDYLTSRTPSASNSEADTDLFYRERAFLEPQDLVALGPLTGDDRVRCAARLASNRYHAWLLAVDEAANTRGLAYLLRIREPGIPELGSLDLEMSRLDPEGQYLEKADDLARIVLRSQLRSGGWDSDGYCGERRRDRRCVGPDAGPASFRRTRDLMASGESQVMFPNLGKFRCDPTQNSVIFLLQYSQLRRGPDIRERIRRGLEFILDNQLDCGAWPGAVDEKVGDAYERLPCFNDGAINHCVDALIAAYREYQDPAYLRAIVKAGAYILAVRGQTVARDAGGEFVQAGWAQHYDLDGRPAPARVFEPVSLSSLVTARNIATLEVIAQLTGDRAYLQAVPAAREWLNRSRLADGSWSRLYEIGTNRPFWCEPTGRKRYDMDDPAIATGEYMWKVMLPGEALGQPEAARMSAQDLEKRRTAVLSEFQAGGWDPRVQDGKVGLVYALRDAAAVLRAGRRP